MSTTPVSGNKALEAISNSYKKVAKEEDPLGREAFLTMLVAQLKNQDPLNPLDGTDFTAQLAQFSSLEQQFEMNDNLQSVVKSLEAKSDSNYNLVDYIGKHVEGEVENIELNDGVASGGYYTLTEPAVINIQITDLSGNEIRMIDAGQKDPGSFSVGWDGMDNFGEPLPDGSYKYEVFARDATGGYYKVQTTITGEVDGIMYKNDKPYLQIGEALMDASSVTKIWENTES